MFETHYDVHQPSFCQQNLQALYLDTESFILSVNTKDGVNELKNLKDLFDFCNLNKKLSSFSNKIKISPGKGKA